jgi:hypothetical protein
MGPFFFSFCLLLLRAREEERRGERELSLTPGGSFAVVFL